MTDFLTTLKELREKATKGEWLRDHGPYDFDGAGSEAYADIYVNYEGSEDDAPDETLIAKYNDLIPEGHANAALIVHLVNHAEDIVALVEAAQASLDRPRPDLVAVPGGGHTTRNLQEIVEFDSAARERIRAALSRLEAKP